MRTVRQEIGGIGNLMFKQAFLWGQMRKGIIPDIYVQSPRYWQEFAGEIRQMFGQGIGKIDKVALHIRRGDYLKGTQFHTNLWDTSYYTEAVSLFQNDKFLVFCKDTQNPEMDKADQEWCRENLPSLGIDFEMYEHGEESDDLNAMASCKGIIGANSTFSFWAAFLGEPSKKVVMPKEERWFTDGALRVELPLTWTKL